MTMIIVVVALIVALAYWQNSTSLNILAGILTVAFGLYWIQTEGVTDYINIVIGIVSGMIGFHLWVKTAISIWGKKE